MPDHWQETTLGEVGEVNPKEAPLAEDAPFVPMDAVNVGQRWVEYTEPRGTRSGARARAGDVLFARITPCLENGKTAQVQHEIDRCGGSTEFIVLRGTERLDANFLYFWATDRNVRERAANLMTGSTGRQRLSPKDLAAMTLSVPPISEQRRIVDLVGSIDTYIDSLETQIETTRTARSALLSELLSNPGDDWQETTLGDVAVLEYGKALKESDRDGIGFPVFGSAGEVGRHSVPLVTEGPVIIVGRKGTAGSVHWSPEPCSVIDTAYWVRLVNENLRTDFAFHAISSLNLPSLSAQTGVPGLNRERAYSQPFGVPPVAEQRRIVDLVGSFDEQISSLESQVETVRTLRSGVLSELLSGERLLDESYDLAVGI